MLLLAACGSAQTAGTATSAPAGPAAQQASTLSLTSSDVHDGGTIALTHVYNATGCTGQNLSPALAWSGAPAATRSFALTVHDPDAPHPGGWWHWAVYDIPAATASLPRGAGTAGSKGMPSGAKQGRNDFGDSTYDGPCPPAGAPHHYDVVLSALDVSSLNLPPGAAAAQVGFTIGAHTIASAKLTGLYGR
ncbi:MAG TPA: YbhB/YbcL family Raf kinase inhibitor-like protein [Candidatus Dormibacteraeota bacterium]